MSNNRAGVMQVCMWTPVWCPHVPVRTSVRTCIFGRHPQLSSTTCFLGVFFRPVTTWGQQKKKKPRAEGVIPSSQHPESLISTKLFHEACNINRKCNSFVVKAGCFQRRLEARRGGLVPSVPFSFYYLLCGFFPLHQFMWCVYQWLVTTWTQTSGKYNVVKWYRWLRNFMRAI